jgi:hypothetical protein
LDRGFRFEIGELGRERRLRSGRQDMRVVDDATGQGRKGGRRQRRREGEQREERKREPAQNFTFGAVSEPGVAANSAIGLERE